MALPRVAGVGIGERDGEPVIKVFVTEEVQESELAAGERVPASLEGYEVDVEGDRLLPGPAELGVRMPVEEMELEADAAAKLEGPRRRAVEQLLDPEALTANVVGVGTGVKWRNGSRPASRRCSSS